MKKNKEELKTYFERGDKPTEEQFSDLIDSYIDAKQLEGEANRRFVIDENGEVLVDSEQAIPEYTLSDLSGNKLGLLKDGVIVKEVDLTAYIDDTNLARLVSGTVESNGVAIFKRDDNSTFEVDFSSVINSSVSQIQADWSQSDDRQPDFIKAKPSFKLQNNFAVVGRANITHTPKIGSFDKFFNNLDDLLTIVESEYNNKNFTIIIMSDGVFPITKAFSTIQGISFYSQKKTNNKTSKSNV